MGVLQHENIQSKCPSILLSYFNQIKLYWKILVKIYTIQFDENF